MNPNAVTTPSMAPAPKKTFDLFVGDLSFFCEEHDLLEIFSAFGPVEAVRLVKNNARKKSLMYGFVSYSSGHAAVRAINELNGKVIMGRPIKVELSEQGTPQQENKPAATQGVEVYVHFRSSFPRGMVVRPTEAFLRGIFEKYGPILDVVVRKYAVQETLQTQEGYGFVTFAFHDDAQSAATNCNLSVFDGIELSVSIGHRNSTLSHFSSDFFNSVKANDSSATSNSQPQPQTQPPPAPAAAPLTSTAFDYNPKLASSNEYASSWISGATSSASSVVSSNSSFSAGSGDQYYHHHQHRIPPVDDPRFFSTSEPSFQPYSMAGQRSRPQRYHPQSSMMPHRYPSSYVPNNSFMQRNVYPVQQNDIGRSYPQRSPAFGFDFPSSGPSGPQSGRQQQMQYSNQQRQTASQPPYGSNGLNGLPYW